MKLTLERIMTLEMELCALLLDTLDARVLGPPKMQKGEDEKGLQALEWDWSVCKKGLKKKCQK